MSDGNTNTQQDETTHQTATANMHEPLEALRFKIDQADAGIFKLLEKRQKLVLEVVEYKKRAGLPVKDNMREGDLLAKLAKNLDKNSILTNEDLLMVWGKIIEISLKLQEQKID